MHYLSLITCGCCLMTCLNTFWHNRTVTSYLILFSAVYVCILEGFVLLLGMGSQIVSLKLFLANLATYFVFLYLAYRSFKKRHPDNV